MIWPEASKPDTAREGEILFAKCTLDRCMRQLHTQDKQTGSRACALGGAVGDSSTRTFWEL